MIDNTRTKSPLINPTSVFAAGLSGVVIGTAFAWNSAAARLTRTYGNSVRDYGGETDDSGWYVDAVACYFLGTAVGGLILGPVTRNIGYRWSVVGCDTVVLIGWLLLSQVNLAPVWAIRLAHGIGTGGLGLLIPTYIVHIADFRIRGEIFFRNYNARRVGRKYVPIEIRHYRNSIIVVQWCIYRVLYIAT